MEITWQFLDATNAVIFEKLEMTILEISVKCPKCDNTATIYGTISFLNALIEKHITQTKAFNKLRKELTNNKSDQEIAENFTFEEIDIHNTNIFNQNSNFIPIVQWFEKQNIQVQINPNTIDTTGFFDEIALLLGNNFGVRKLREQSDKIYSK